MSGGGVSPFGLVHDADFLGKSVIAILFCASIWCWALIVENLIAANALGQAIAVARSGGNIFAPLIAPLLCAGETAAAVAMANETQDGRHSRIEGAMTQESRRLLLRAGSGLSNLGVIFLVAPVVGLSGAFWSSQSGTAGLAATIIFGLAVALPAWIGRTFLSLRLSRIAADLGVLVHQRADDLVSGRAAAPASAFGETAYCEASHRQRRMFADFIFSGASGAMIAAACPAPSLPGRQGRGASS